MDRRRKTGKATSGRKQAVATQTARLPHSDCIRRPSPFIELFGPTGVIDAGAVALPLLFFKRPREHELMSLLCNFVGLTPATLRTVLNLVPALPPLPSPTEGSTARFAVLRGEL